MTKIKLLKISIIAGITIVILAVLGFFMIYKATFSEYGNPLPYLIKATQLNDTKTFVKVKDSPPVYIAKCGSDNEFVKYVEKTYNVTYYDRGGAAFIFKGNENENRIVVADVRGYIWHFNAWKIYEHYAST